jgi:hypothetical protein
VWEKLAVFFFPSHGNRERSWKADTTYRIFSLGGVLYGGLTHGFHVLTFIRSAADRKLLCRLAKASTGFADRELQPWWLVIFVTSSLQNYI